MKITAYAKYGCKIFGRYKLMCAIIIIQLTAVLCALNIAIGNYNSRNMLYVPFEDILSKDGLLCFMMIYAMMKTEMISASLFREILSFTKCLTN